MHKTFQKLWIAVLMAFRGAFLGPAHKNIEQPKRILIVQLSQLGDMVCTTPVFRAIKRQYPESRLVVLGSALNKELLRDNTDVDEYIVASSDFFGLLKKIRAMNFDFAAITSPNFINLALLYLAGIGLIAVPRIVNGYSPYVTRLYKMFMGLAIIKPHHMRQYAPREYLRLLEPIGITTDETIKHLGFSETSRNSIDKFFVEHGVVTGDLVVGISPTAGNKIKMWGVEKFARVGDHLSGKYNAKIIILASKGEENTAQDMARLMQQQGIIGTDFNLDELKACVARLSLFISVDTGPIYVAEAFNVPTIDITGPIDEREQPPIGSRHLVIPPKDRKGPELFVMNARVYDTAEAKRQADSIQADDIISVLDDFIKTIR